MDEVHHSPKRDRLLLARKRRTKLTTVTTLCALLYKRELGVLLPPCTWFAVKLVVPELLALSACVTRRVLDRHKRYSLGLEPASHIVVCSISTSSYRRH